MTDRTQALSFSIEKSQSERCPAEPSLSPAMQKWAFARNFCFAVPDWAAYVVFFKENRIKFDSAMNVDRKSGFARGRRRRPTFLQRVLAAVCAFPLSVAAQEVSSCKGPAELEHV